MKRFIKIILLVVLLVVLFIIGFFTVLHVSEFKPEKTQTIEISELNSNKQVNLNQPITIMTFNTGYASLSQTEDFVMDGGKKGKMDSKQEVATNVEGIKNILCRESADISILQEVDTNSKRSYRINQFEVYKDLLKHNTVFAYNYRVVFVPFPFKLGQMMGRVNSGLATYSAFNINKAIRIQLPGKYSWPVRLAMLKRALLISYLPIQDSDKKLVVINAHLSAYDDGNMRVKELAALQNILNKEYSAGNYVIVGGDFNQTFPYALESFTNMTNYTYKTKFAFKDKNLWEAFPLNTSWFDDNNYQIIADAKSPTCRLLNKPYDTENHDNNQYYLIDGFIASSNIEVLDFQTIDEDFKYSDHNPVKVSIILKEN